MSRNDTAVTTPAKHLSEAATYLEAAKAYRHALADAYAERPQDRARIGDLHQAIGFGLKVAHVHATLAQAMAALGETSPDVADYLAHNLADPDEAAS